MCDLECSCSETWTPGNCLLLILFCWMWELLVLDFGKLYWKEACSERVSFLWIKEKVLLGESVWVFCEFRLGLGLFSCEGRYTLNFEIRKFSRSFWPKFITRLRVSFSLSFLPFTNISEFPENRFFWGTFCVCFWGRESLITLDWNCLVTGALSFLRDFFESLHNFWKFCFLLFCSWLSLNRLTFLLISLMSTLFSVDRTCFGKRMLYSTRASFERVLFCLNLPYLEGVAGIFGTTWRGFGAPLLTRFGLVVRLSVLCGLLLNWEVFEFSFNLFDDCS